MALPTRMAVLNYMFDHNEVDVKEVMSALKRIMAVKNSSTIKCISIICWPLKQMVYVK